VNRRITKAIAAVGAAGALAGIPAQAGAVQAHAATTKHITITLNSPSKPSSGAATVHGTVSGTLRGTFTAVVIPPKTNYVFKFAGGTVKVTAVYALGPTLMGPWHTTGGTGKYRHVKGSGTAYGKLTGPSAGIFHLSGKLKY
jgi:hypothetical protein